jgi:hypothetical protein
MQIIIGAPVRGVVESHLRTKGSLFIAALRQEASRPKPAAAAPPWSEETAFCAAGQ